MANTIIKERMKDYGMLQIELSEKTGISIASIKQIVNAKVEPGILAAISIAKVLNTEVQVLFNKEGKAIEI